jgi:hypothetical protein
VGYVLKVMVFKKRSDENHLLRRKKHESAEIEASKKNYDQKRFLNHPANWKEPRGTFINELFISMSLEDSKYLMVTDYGTQTSKDVSVYQELCKHTP